MIPQKAQVRHLSEHVLVCVASNWLLTGHPCLSVSGRQMSWTCETWTLIWPVPLHVWEPAVAADASRSFRDRNSVFEEFQSSNDADVRHEAAPGQVVHVSASITRAVPRLAAKQCRKSFRQLPRRGHIWMCWTRSVQRHVIRGRLVMLITAHACLYQALSEVQQHTLDSDPHVGGGLGVLYQPQHRTPFHCREAIPLPNPHCGLLLTTKSQNITDVSSFLLLYLGRVSCCCIILSNRSISL
ncbi:hypothetical protein B0H66DRAFT_215580 [Apodospora peruviana]|uniref:Uncharacterized protein n=1 Tax=Apodospora peruviana TaxID=516989 RepID=A0AAE0ID75_9PEZI|nr:hypothetical protein B0H66DRAFT_215580 [Apodospora peruviana]